jgi:hypothetical protein
MSTATLAETLEELQQTIHYPELHTTHGDFAMTFSKWVHNKGRNGDFGGPKINALRDWSEVTINHSHNYK